MNTIKIFLIFVLITFALSVPVPFKRCGGPDHANLTTIEFNENPIIPGTEFTVTVPIMTD